MLRHTRNGPGRTPVPVLKPLTSPFAPPVRVDRAVCMIGSHPRVHLPLTSPMVSRTHAILVVEGVDAYIRDLASRNGVYVNGSLAHEARLLNGDLLCVGPFAFRWCAGPLPGPRPRSLSPVPKEESATVWLEGEPAPRTIAGRTFLIGQRGECDLPLNNLLVGPVHAVIYRRADRHFIRDLNSKTGTFVNGRRVRDEELHAGDEIRVAVKRMKFTPARVEDGPREPEVAADSPAAGAALAGLSALANADHPAGRPARVPTIEELLGTLNAPPDEPSPAAALAFARPKWV